MYEPPEPPWPEYEGSGWIPEEDEINDRPRCS